jgi:hypothetical protein
MQFLKMLVKKWSIKDKYHKSYSLYAHIYFFENKKIWIFRNMPLITKSYFF